MQHERPDEVIGRAYVAPGDDGTAIFSDRLRDLREKAEQVDGRLDRMIVELERIGEARFAAERCCHALADALQTGDGVDEALAAYRAMEW